MQNMYILNKIQYSKELRKQFEDFSIAYPSLFNIIIEDPFHFNMARLTHMLNLKKEVDNNKISYEVASSKLGQEYYDEFVKPTVDNLDENK